MIQKTLQSRTAELLTKDLKSSVLYDRNSKPGLYYEARMTFPIFATKAFSFTQQSLGRLCAKNLY